MNSNILTTDMMEYLLDKSIRIYINHKDGRSFPMMIENLFSEFVTRFETLVIIFDNTDDALYFRLKYL